MSPIQVLSWTYFCVNTGEGYSNMAWPLATVPFLGFLFQSELVSPHAAQLGIHFLLLSQLLEGPD